MASQSYMERVEELCRELRARRVSGSLEAAKRTAELLRQLVTSSRLTDPQSLLEEVKRIGVKIQLAKPIELAIGNIVRRVMHIIREEIDAGLEEQDDDLRHNAAGVADSSAQPAVGGLSRALRPGAPIWAARAQSLRNLLDQDVLEAAAAAHAQLQLAATPQGAPQAPAQQAAAPAQQQEGRRPSLEEKERRGGKAPQWDRKQEVIEGVNDLIDELKDIDNSIAQQAVEHIHANEMILTFGYSRTVLHFLRRAREKRSFRVVVAEAAPTYQGLQMAADLADTGIETTVITDAEVYAMMARVNKVLVTAHAILANGGAMAPVGMHIVAMAAKRHSVPCVMLCGMFKLSPLFPHEPGVTFNDFKDPSDILPSSDQAVLAPFLAAAAAAAARAGAPAGDGDEALPGSPLGSGGAAAAASPPAPRLAVHNPSYDYVPPELISLFVTDQGPGFMPSYVYRQLSEFYNSTRLHNDVGLPPQLQHLPPCRALCANLSGASLVNPKALGLTMRGANAAAGEVDVPPLVQNPTLPPPFLAGLAVTLLLLAGSFPVGPVLCLAFVFVCFGVAARAAAMYHCVRQLGGLLAERHDALVMFSNHHADYDLLLALDEVEASRQQAAVPQQRLAALPVHVHQGTPTHKRIQRVPFCGSISRRALFGSARAPTAAAAASEIESAADAYGEITPASCGAPGCAGVPDRDGGAMMPVLVEEIVECAESRDGAGDDDAPLCAVCLEAFEDGEEVCGGSIVARGARLVACLRRCSFVHTAQVQGANDAAVPPLLAAV
eukprot:scaffold29.g5916.t1